MPPWIRPVMYSFAAIVSANLALNLFMAERVIEQGHVSRERNSTTKVWRYDILREGFRFKVKVCHPGGSCTVYGPYKSMQLAMDAALEIATQAAEEWVQNQPAPPPIISTEKPKPGFDPGMAKPPGIADFLAGQGA